MSFCDVFAGTVLTVLPHVCMCKEVILMISGVVSSVYKRRKGGGVSDCKGWCKRFQTIGAEGLLDRHYFVVFEGECIPFC